MLAGLKEVAISIGEDVGVFIKEKPLGAAAIGAGALGVTTLGLVAIGKVKAKKKKKITISKRKKPTKKKPCKRKSKLKFGSPAWRKKYCKKGKTRRIRYTPHTAGKGKDTSQRRIRHTKHGQPYIILASGKARFIKKSSARRSRKLKGGRY